MSEHEHAWILAGTCTFDGCEARLTSVKCDECSGSGKCDYCPDPAHRLGMGQCGPSGNCLRCNGLGVVTVVQEADA